ncbi:hypothetical protein ACFQNF_19645 [Iodobacter arcticus]|uniref:Uncharacterized protein n=1 Tax=Iodobacter arcticus TaxID=590593 RepID=A0ABW2R6L4_9NEIS
MRVSLLGVPLMVDFYFQPAERPSEFYPGCEKELVLTKARLSEPEDLIELLIKLDLVAQVEVTMLARLAALNSDEGSFHA